MTADRLRRVKKGKPHFQSKNSEHPTMLNGIRGEPKPKIIINWN